MPQTRSGRHKLSHTSAPLAPIPPKETKNDYTHENVGHHGGNGASSRVPYKQEQDASGTGSQQQSTHGRSAIKEEFKNHYLPTSSPYDDDWFLRFVNFGQNLLEYCMIPFTIIYFIVHMVCSVGERLRHYWRVAPKCTLFVFFLLGSVVLCGCIKAGVVSGISSQARATMDHNARLDETIGRLNVTASNIQEVVNQMTELIADLKGKPDLHQPINKFGDIAEMFNRTLTVNGTLGDDVVDGVYSHLMEHRDNLNRKAQALGGSLYTLSELLAKDTRMEEIKKTGVWDGTYIEDVQQQCFDIQDADDLLMTEKNKSSVYIGEIRDRLNKLEAADQKELNSLNSIVAKTWFGFFGAGNGERREALETRIGMIGRFHSFVNDLSHSLKLIETIVRRHQLTATSLNVLMLRIESGESADSISGDMVQKRMKMGRGAV